MENGKQTLLVVEDESQIRKLLDMALSLKGYKTVMASDGMEGMTLAVSHRPDAIILDLGLPDIDGMEVLERLRKWYTNPIIILSARRSEKDIVNALDSGASDYVSKPFIPGELTARIRASLRKNETSQQDEPIHTVGDLSVDIAGHTVTRGGTRLEFTPTEFELIVMFIKNVGRVLTHSYIMGEIWGEHMSDTQSLRVFIAQLRKKIEDNPAKPALLVTESGIGYRFG
jgi:two-component system KDP operon response regulator KdpE